MIDSAPSEPQTCGSKPPSSSRPTRQSREASRRYRAKKNSEYLALKSDVQSLRDQISYLRAEKARALEAEERLKVIAKEAEARALVAEKSTAELGQGILRLRLGIQSALIVLKDLQNQCAELQTSPLTPSVEVDRTLSSHLTTGELEFLDLDILRTIDI